MTADPRAVEIAARALEDVQPPESDPSLPDEAFFDDARRVFDALGAAGWSLLPPGGEGDEWRYYTVEADGDSTAYVLCRSDDACEWTYVHTGRYYLTLGEAADAATEHAKKHAADAPGGTQ